MAKIRDELSRLVFSGRYVDAIREAKLKSEAEAQAALEVKKPDSSETPAVQACYFVHPF